MENKRPTICAECAHMEKDTWLPWCFAKVSSVDLVTGANSYRLCRNVNNGDCALFAPKPRPWWRRLFGSR